MWTYIFVMMLTVDFGWIIAILIFMAGGDIGMNYPVAIGSFIFTIFAYYKYQEELEKEREEDRRRLERSSYSSSYPKYDSGTNRSQWEKDIVSYIRRQYPQYRIITNDRTLIIASDGHTPLEIDIYIPELKLGIEADGIRWHDREAYERDRRNGTEYSEEMYKERYCARKGIKLIHVWDSDGLSTIQRQIDNAIAAGRY